MRFGLKDVGELPSMEEFEKLVAESFQSDLLPAENEQADANGPETEVNAETALPQEDSGSVQSEDSELATLEKQHVDKSNSAA
jgi:segregation and condensation protein B